MKKNKAQLIEELENARMAIYSQAAKHARHVEELRNEYEEELEKRHLIIVQCCLPQLVSHGGKGEQDTAVCPVCKAEERPATVCHNDNGEPFVVTLRPITHKEGCYFLQGDP